MSNTVPKVLVVEDDGTVRRMLVRFLKLNDFQVQDATCFEDAMALIQQEHGFDVVLLDLNFPGGGGLELLPHLRANCENAIVMVVSATEDADLLHQLLSEGASDFISKPFDVTMLLDRIEHHLHPENGAVG